MSLVYESIAWFFSLPVLRNIFAWAEKFPDLSGEEKLEQTTHAFVVVLGSTELLKWIRRFLFRRRSKLERDNEQLEERVAELGRQLRERDAQIQDQQRLSHEFRGRLPEAARAAARKELTENNAEPANRIREKWFAENVLAVAELAVDTAKYHIARAIPDPADHLIKAETYLKLAQAAYPSGHYAKELWLEFDQIKGALHEQALSAPERQVAWNTQMRPELLVRTFQDAAVFILVAGKYRIASIVADRLCDLASIEKSRNHMITLNAERTRAVIYRFNGFYKEALQNLRRAITDAQLHLPPSNSKILEAKVEIAFLLEGMGEYRSARDEIAHLWDILLETFGPRHHNTLVMRWIRAKTLTALEFYTDALAELSSLVPLEVEVLGDRHADVFAAKALRASTLSEIGQYSNALAEFEAIEPLQAATLGPKHPEVLATRLGRAHTLSEIGRYSEALAELDAINALQTVTLGLDSPRALLVRSVRAETLSKVARSSEALRELDEVAALLTTALGDAHPYVLTAPYRRARVLGDLGRYADAISELDTLAAKLSRSRETGHINLLLVESLRAGLAVEVGEGDSVLEVLLGLSDALKLAKGTLATSTLHTEYRLARALFVAEKFDAARGLTSKLITEMAPIFAEEHVVLRSLRVLLAHVDGGSRAGPLIV